MPAPPPPWPRAIGLSLWLHARGQSGQFYPSAHVSARSRLSPASGRACGSACGAPSARSRAAAPPPRRSSRSGRAPAGSARARPSRAPPAARRRRARTVARPDLQRDRVGGDPIARRQDRHPLDDVAQLAHVAGPGVAFEQRAPPPARSSAAGSCSARRTRTGSTAPARRCPAGARAAPARGSARRSAGRTDPRGTCRPRRARRAGGWWPRSTRTVTRIVCSPPTRWNSPSCRTRSSLACDASCRSPTSSRKIVPPSASSNLPRRSAAAPVNAPFSWPNSSLSISSVGIAAQFTFTNGPAANGLSRWMCAASSSLPVPDSPISSTRTSDRATCVACCTALLEHAGPIRSSSARRRPARGSAGSRAAGPTTRARS